MTPVKRKLLSRTGNIATRQFVYRIPDGLEIDEIDHYEVHRSRVLFDDVVLMTYHRYVGVTVVITVLVLVLLFVWSAYAIAQSDATTAWIFFAATGGPLLVVLLLRLIVRVDEMNVYSRRSQARLRTFFRKRRLRRLFNEFAADVRRRQRVAAPPRSTLHDTSRDDHPPSVPPFHDVGVPDTTVE